MKKHLELFGQLCFWIAIITETLLVLIDKSAYINPYEGILFRLTFCLFCLKILATKYTRKEWLAMIIVGLIAVISYLINDKDEIVRVVALVAACKGIEIKKITKVLFYLTLAGGLVIILLSVFGIYGDSYVIADFGRGPSGSPIIECRYTLGMGHPNALQCMMLMTTVLGIYTYCTDMKWWHYLVVGALNIVIYFMTDSNTGMLGCCILIVGYLFFQLFPNAKESKWVYLLGAFVIVFCVAFSMAGAGIENTYETPNSLMHKIDLHLNGRFQTTYRVEAARLQNWKLFGASDNTEFFDPAFVRVAYWYGIIPFIMYVIMNLYLVFIAFQKKDYALMVIVATFAVYSVMEAHLISIYILRNYLFLFLGCQWTNEANQNACYLWQCCVVPRKAGKR